jgi:hypothetical protein
MWGLYMRFAYIFTTILCLVSSIPGSVLASPIEQLDSELAELTVILEQADPDFASRGSDQCALARANAEGAVALCEKQKDILSCVQCGYWCAQLRDCLIEEGSYFEAIFLRCTVRCEQAFKNAKAVSAD